MKSFVRDHTASLPCGKSCISQRVEAFIYHENYPAFFALRGDSFFQIRPDELPVRIVRVSYEDHAGVFCYIAKEFLIEGKAEALLQRIFRDLSISSLQSHGIARVARRRDKRLFRHHGMYRSHDEFRRTVSADHIFSSGSALSEGRGFKSSYAFAKLLLLRVRILMYLGKTCLYGIKHGLRHVKRIEVYRKIESYLISVHVSPVQGFTYICTKFRIHPALLFDQSFPNSA